MMLFLEIKGYLQYINLFFLPLCCFFKSLWQALDLISCYCLELLYSEKYLLCFSPEMDAIHWWLKWSFNTYNKSIFLSFSVNKDCQNFEHFLCKVHSKFKRMQKWKLKWNNVSLSPKLMLPQSWRWSLAMWLFCPWNGATRNLFLSTYLNFISF